MAPDDILDLFCEFGPVTLKRAFSGHVISADGVNFAMSLKSGVIMRVDELTVSRYDAEGAKPFSYSTAKKTVVVQSYRMLPERLYDDPEELAVWSREALEAARRAKLKKAGKRRGAARGKTSKATKPARKSVKAAGARKSLPKKKAAPKRDPKAVKSVRK